MRFHQFAFVGCALDDPPSDTEHAREHVAGPVGAARETQWSEWFCAQSPGKSLACCGNLNNHAATPSSSSGGQRILFSCLHSADVIATRVVTLPIHAAGPVLGMAL
jgi:hypothetical protein